MIILRDTRYPPNRPPCECQTFYSIDDGATWMSQKEYFRWQTNFFTVINRYDAIKSQGEGISPRRCPGAQEVH